MRQTRIDEFLELEYHNKELEKRIKEEVAKNREKDKLMFQQSKLASLGEMLGNISHQWRQPLMEINSLFLPIEAKITLGVPLEDNEILQTIDKLNHITKYMSNTIDDFKNFFATDKEKIKFKLLEQINSTVNIISGGLKTHNVKLDIIIKKNPEIIAYKNDYSQVLINIINNAKDVLVQRKIGNPYIKISIYEENKNIITTVEDNAGGVKVNPIEKIFDPFFTYEKMGGSGIGLFMSKLIIEKNMNGKLSVENTSNGAFFKIIIPKI
ncbi:signal transduction sensor histidine kinase [Arcobacter venerupis]|jgi:C4-dicarboxylate-specific signal transduction histidine kinase|uniref:histidine kinase n=1 Tax=Arcobacter venerupis TaxID=1054033 RepID=A0AAE7B6E4_9BACT|nr:HAMP domain-containing sensor histidine kinase [Arcobacter venerupis]QKF65881.1 signal transduction sensor histidine kinase [Arcobacter venerupis]RWS49242.1 histidine kinase [Arcobacter venerupis]